MKKILMILLTMFSCFYCFAERECNEIPEEYKETKVFKWSEKKHGRKYFEKNNWQWKLKPGATFMDPLAPCSDSGSPCIVVGNVCVHGDLFNKRKSKWDQVIIRHYKEGKFILQFETKDVDKFYALLCETADKDYNVFFRNLKRKMGDNMKWFYTSGSGDDKVPYYEITFKV